mmetsp:Transcript_27552/g.60647  ORF Transcript_27552/g.60647 Transcript_27552/m.60647 type:complete len:112 (-) Transcript_27552:185-520(-)
MIYFTVVLRCIFCYTNVGNGDSSQHMTWQDYLLIDVLMHPTKAGQQISLRASFFATINRNESLEVQARYIMNLLMSWYLLLETLCGHTIHMDACIHIHPYPIIRHAPVLLS